MTRIKWFCKGDGKLLGIREGRRVHIRYGKHHEYLAELPVTAVCRGCGAVNELLPEGLPPATHAAA